MKHVRNAYNLPLLKSPKFLWKEYSNETTTLKAFAEWLTLRWFKWLSIFFQPRQQQRRRPSNSRERYLKLSEIDRGSSAAASTAGGGTFAYNIKGLQQQTKYAILVQTLNEAGWSPESRIFEFTTSQMGK